MSPQRRRSSRLRTPAKSLQTTTTPQLTTLTEHDEPPQEQPQLDISTPRTPATAGRIIPAREEMHPSISHKSTTQKPDSGLKHGFKDINAKGDDQPSGVQQQSPSKIGISSATFDFKFARPAPVLGPEAQRMMDELREEALRIKARLAAQKEEEENKAKATGLKGGRKIAKAKGKATRFSDVHMAEFKKMDSIAGHASSYRAQPGRITPATTGIKRTQSKAQLDEREDTHRLVEESTEIANEAQSDRLENTAPAKRARQRITDDTSSSRPISRGNDKPAQAQPNSRGNSNIPAMPSTPRSHVSSIIASLSTPTQASMARAASVRQPATQIPSLSRSPSKPNLQNTSRGLAKPGTMSSTAGSMTAPSKVASRTPSKFDRVKSILKYPNFGAKKTDKASAIPSLTSSASKLNINLEQELPSVPTTPIGTGRSKIVKHVEFTPDTRKADAATVPQSPSPVKSGIPRSTSKSNLKAASSVAPRRPTSQLSGEPDQANHSQSSGTVVYPSLAGVRPLPDPPRQTAIHQAFPHPPASVPGTFTFRSDHTISFGVSPKGFGSSPNQATVRQVRRSIFPSTMPGSFPESNKENVDNLPKESNKQPAAIPTVPHGMSNKKRRRVESDEEEDRSPKKRQPQAPEGEMLMAPRLHAEREAAVPKSPAKKRGLTLSRLNMLARPKNRR